MRTFEQIKKNDTLLLVWKLIIASLLIGFLAAFLAVVLKHTTDFFEELLIKKSESNKIYLLVFPFLGLTIIHFLRHYLFRKKENKGIKEVFEVTQSKSKNLPLYKIPYHFVNGLLTVIFGGSTGIEVSTVVATATIGSASQQKDKTLKTYKSELICAGVTAGITALFCSPLAGILFSIEVISKKTTKFFLLTNGISLLTAWSLIQTLNEKPLFDIKINHWHYHAIPYFIVLGILAGLNSVYITKCVLFFKSKFYKIEKSFAKIIIGSIILSTALLIFPQLYGDGYHSVRELFDTANTNFSIGLITTFIGILVLKPIVTSATLASGGDGGVFAPSLFIGAFLGLTLASFLNFTFKSNVIPINFMIIGMAAVLSASINAPFTALFLVCGMIHNYTLFFPILLVCYVAKYTSRFIFPHTVYTYVAPISK